MKGIIQYSGRVNIPFQQLKDDPLLVLRNLPQVEKIEYIDVLDYRVSMVTQRYHTGLSVKPVGHVKLEVMDDRIVWHRSDNHCPVECNGVIEGAAVKTEDGMVQITGNIELYHPLINMLTWAAMKPVINQYAKKYIAEFIDNFNDPAFENDVPEGVV